MKKLVIGIVGGIGSGKTEVSKMFGQLGGWVFHADPCVHLLLKDLAIKEKIINQFGARILDEDGNISRGELGKIVFSETESRKVLEDILHPEVRKKAVESIELGQKSCLHSFVILDIPLLLEKGWRDLCDFLVFVDCGSELRKARAKERGWTEELWIIREISQMPLTNKALLCDYNIINSADLNETFHQVRALVEKLIPTLKTHNQRVVEVETECQ